jgi:hypothetical protein
MLNRSTPLWPSNGKGGRPLFSPKAASPRTRRESGGFGSGGGGFTVEILPDNDGLPVHALLQRGDLETAADLVRRGSVDVMLTDHAGNSALHVACLAARGATALALETVQVSFPAGCAAGARVSVQPRGQKEAVLVTVPNAIPPGGVFVAALSQADSPRKVSPSTVTAAMRVVDALVDRGGVKLVTARNHDGHWAGQLCRPGDSLNKLLSALHQALVQAVAERDRRALEELRCVRACVRVSVSACVACFACRSVNTHRRGGNVVMWGGGESHEPSKFVLRQNARCGPACRRTLLSSARVFVVYVCVCASEAARVRVRV